MQICKNLDACLSNILRDVDLRIIMYKNGVFFCVETKQRYVWISLLLIIETILYAWLNTPADFHYEQYVARTVGNYNCFFGFIFWENLKSSLSLILMGMIPLGLGVIFGTYLTARSLVAAIKWLLPEIGAGKMLLCLLPHGIFEVAAIFLSVFLAVLLSRTVTLSIARLARRKPVMKPLQEECQFLLKSVLLVLIPLLLLAAAMEVTVSKWVTASVL